MHNSWQRYRAPLATHDSLTELPARTHFESRLAQALNAAERYERELSVIFIDVDMFKNVNDIHGQMVGDEVHVSVAKCLR